jgi:hypothetical protein
MIGRFRNFLSGNEQRRSILKNFEAAENLLPRWQRLLQFVITPGKIYLCALIRSCS